MTARKLFARRAKSSHLQGEKYFSGWQSHRIKMDFHFISPCGAKLYEVTEVKMEQNELQRTLMAILFAAGEPVAASRLSETLAVDEAQIHEELKYLMNELAYHAAASALCGWRMRIRCARRQNRRNL